MSPYDTFLGTVPFPLDLALIESMTFPTFSTGRMFCLFRWVTRKYCSSDALHPSQYCTFIRSIFFNLICNLCNLDFSTLAQKKIIVCFFLMSFGCYIVISVLHPLFNCLSDTAAGGHEVWGIGCIPQDSPPFCSLIAWFSVSHDLTDQTETTLKGRWYQEFLIVQWCSGWRDVW